MKQSIDVVCHFLLNPSKTINWLVSRRRRNSVPFLRNQFVVWADTFFSVGLTVFLEGGCSSFCLFWLADFIVGHVFFWFYEKRREKKWLIKYSAIGRCWSVVNWCVYLAACGMYADAASRHGRSYVDKQTDKYLQMRTGKQVGWIVDPCISQWTTHTGQVNAWLIYWLIDLNDFCLYRLMV